MMNTEIISMVTSKEEGGKMRLGRGLTDGFNSIYHIIFILGGRESKENKTIYKTGVCPIIFYF